MAEENNTPVEETVTPAEENAEVETPVEEAPEEEHVPTAEEWQAALETAVKQRDDLQDKLLRSQADFQNFKRRNATARSEGYEDGKREVIAAMLGTIDTLERALKAAEDHGETGSIVEGVRMTLKTTVDALEKLGLKEIPALGEKFDPDLHNAVMRSEEGEPGTVLEVFQKGYRVGDRVIRYSMVKVAAE